MSTTAGTLAILWMPLPPLLMHYILSFLLLAYVARCFLIVVEETAGGNESVEFPYEIWHEWVWRFLYLIGLAALWLIPFYVLCSWFDAPEGVGAAGTLLFLFFLYPISLLSSLSGTSRWMVLRPALLWRLVHRPGQWILFYLSSGALFLGWFILNGPAMALPILWIPDVDPAEPYAQHLKISLWLGYAFLVPLGTTATAVCLLIYARLLGRLGWIATLVELRSDVEEEAEAVIPELETAGVAAGVTEETYAMQPAVATPQIKLDLHPELMTPQEVVSIAATSAASRYGCMSMSVLLNALPDAENPQEAPEPPPSLFRGVWTFPFHRANLGMLGWVGMSLFLVQGALLLIAHLMGAF